MTKKLTDEQKIIKGGRAGHVVRCEKTGREMTASEWGEHFSTVLGRAAHLCAQQVHRACRTGKPWRGLSFKRVQQ